MKEESKQITADCYDAETNSIEWIDMENWDRKEIFDFYLGTDLPYIIVTANIDVSKPLAFAHKHKVSFNLVMVYLAVKTLDQIPNYRYRFIDGKVFMIDHTRPLINHLIPGRDVFVTGEGPMPCDDILEFCRVTHDNLMTANNDAQTKQHGKLGIINFTAIPWIQYTAFVRTIQKDGVDNAPKISFGKYFADPTDPGRTWMPVSSQTHHGLMDGRHVGRFYENLQKACDELEV